MTTLLSCQQAELMEEEEEIQDGRHTDGEAPADSTTVNTEFDINGWDEAIDVNFNFG